MYNAGLMTSGTTSGSADILQLKAKRTEDSSTRTLLSQVNPLMTWKYSSETGSLNSLLFRQLNPFEENSTFTISTNPGCSNLTLQAPDSQDSGIYTAVIDTLMTEQSDCHADNGREDPPCNDLILPLLTHTAIARPVAYQLKVEGKAYLYYSIVKM